MHIKEIEKVSSLEPLERYKYFIKKVADNELIYTLIDSSRKYVTSIVDGKELLPMWSSIDFVNLCKVNGWELFEIKKIDFDDLENEVFDIIGNYNYLINVFPVNDRTGFVVDIEEFANDLKEELENYS